MIGRTSSSHKWAVCGLICALGVLLSVLATPTEAHSRHPYSMEILVDGVPVEAHHARGKTYIEAEEGCEYSIRLRNHTGRRVAVALSVDGLNSIDAKTTTSQDATKWILSPHQTVTLDGWQTGSTTARRFFFTTENESYGAWLGKTRNLGLISAAFFQEKVPQPMLFEERESGRRRAPRSGRPADAGEQRAEADSLSDENAATGIGREIDHHVRRVRFDAESHPAAVVELRYEYHDSLVALGVLPPRPVWKDPLDRRESARGFEDFEFAPVPPR